MTTVNETGGTTAAHRVGGALLAAYRPGPDRAFFAGPRRTLLATGSRVAVTDPAEATRLLREARTAERPDPLVVGAVPFAPGRPAALFIPAETRWAQPVHDDPLLRLAPEPQTGPVWTSRPVPAPEGYREAVADAVRILGEDQELSKVVLARTLELSAPGGADLPAMLRRLIHRDPHGYTFAVPGEGSATLVGASPELLVSRRGTAVTSNPLAGSAARSDDPVEDRRRAAALLESPKDLAEHAFVVDAVRRALEPHCHDLVVPERPSVIRTAAMWHLSTVVTGTLRDPATSALDLALALHPTPAVCGTPTDRARALIGTLEPFDRGFYTGVVGWGDAYGDGEWVITLRCAEADGDDLRLFAGAGVVAASVPEHELAETTAKFRTFLHAVGLGDAK
ncbi:isochorismate synthase [Kitasatospora sp. NPDC058218]|uniref:isochorismate synthase n=1 Tax=Kitasatospora sp. NPDC058218 TaxID=3346385 RepID=UPI0036DF8229